MNGLRVKHYAYRDAARQAEVRAMLEQIRSDPDAGWLLADSFDEPDEPEPEPTTWEIRKRRLAIIASLRMNESSDPAPPDALTVAQAAEILGVTPRTIQRYKHDLRAMAGAS